MSEKAIADRAIMRTAWGFLGEWWCVPSDIRDDEIETLCAKIHESLASAVPRELIRDRLFGFFACGDGPVRGHVYFSSGSYTFLHPEVNTPMTKADRADVWKKLVEANGKPTAGPFNDYAS